MPPGIVFRVGGALDPSFKGAMAASVAEAKLSAATMMRGMQREITALRTQLVVAPSGAPNLAATAAAINAPIMASIAMREKAMTAIVAGAAAERVAIVKAEQLAMLTAVAKGGIAGSAFGSHRGPGGGISGIMRETLVIFREIGRGNLTRVPGSVLLLAQYMGVLGVVVKSTAAASMLAAAAEEKLAGSMARAALMAEAKAARSLEATTAVGADIAATEALAMADMESAEAARLAAVAQVQKAEAAAEAAAIQKAGATTTIAPIGWLAAAVIALGVAAFFTYRHFHALTVEAKNLKDLLDPLHKKFTEQADAIREDAKAHQEFLDFLKKVGNETETLPEKIEKVIKAMREQAKAEQELAGLRGASKMQIERMEEAELQAELNVVTRGKLEAQRQEESARVAAESADKAFTTNPSEGGIDLKGAQRAAKNAGEVLDAIQDAMESSFGAGEIARIKEASKNNPNAVLGEDEASFINMRQQKKILTGNETPDQAIKIIQGELDKSKFDAKIGSKPIASTLADAQAAYAKATAVSDRLTIIQKELADTLANTKITYEEKHKELQRLTTELADIEAQLGIKKKTGPQIAALEGKSSNEATERERVGLGAPQVALLNVSQQHLAVARQSQSSLHDIQAELMARRKADIERGHAGYFDRKGF